MPVFCLCRLAMDPGKRLLNFKQTSSLAFWDAKMLWLLQYLVEILSNVFLCREWLYWGRKTCRESLQYSASKPVWSFFLDSSFVSRLALLPFYLLQISAEIVALSRGWKDVFWALKKRKLPARQWHGRSSECIPYASLLPRSFKCGSSYSRKLATLINKQSNYTTLLSLLSIEELGQEGVLCQHWQPAGFLRQKSSFIFLWKHRLVLNILSLE